MMIDIVDINASVQNLTSDTLIDVTLTSSILSELDIHSYTMLLISQYFPHLEHQ